MGQTTIRPYLLNLFFIVYSMDDHANILTSVGLAQACLNKATLLMGMIIFGTIFMISIILVY